MNVCWIYRQSLKRRVVMHKTPGSLPSSCSLNRSWGKKEIPDVEFVVAKKDRFIPWVSGYCILREKAKFVINIHTATNGRVPMKEKDTTKGRPNKAIQLSREQTQFSVSKSLNCIFPLCNNKSTRKIKRHYFALWFNLVHTQTVLAFWSAGKKKP